jgi:glycine cleavage system H lipoate-binding protein
MVVLMIILTFLVAVTIEVFIERSKKTVASIENASPKVFTKKNLFLPEGYKVSKNHIWVNGSPSDMKIGIDNFVLDSLGNIIVKDLLPAGSKVRKGQVIASTEISGRTIKFRTPISGEINYVNPRLAASSIKNPYSEDFLYSIKCDNDKLDNLLLGTEAINWIKSEFKRLKEFLVDTPYKPVGVTMYDGGNVVEGIVSLLDDDSLLQFEETFLKCE